MKEEPGEDGLDEDDDESEEEFLKDFFEDND